MVWTLIRHVGEWALWTAGFYVALVVAARPIQRRAKTVENEGKDE